MAEIKKTRTRMYDPWGYQEENNYESSENQFEIELNSLFASATYDDSDKKIHFFNNDGKEISGSSIDTTQFAGGSIIKRAYYDPETKEIVIEFENGDVVKIDAHDLIDEYDFGGGLQVDEDGHVSILVDGSGEPYLSVSDSGIKISGIDQVIATAVAAEQARAEQVEADLQAAIEAEGQRAQDAEAALDAKIDQEITDREVDVDAEEARAKAAEETLDAKIDQEIQDRKDDVDAEEARAEAAEAAANRRIDTLNDALDGEKTIREAADVRLENLITTEKNRAEGIEQTLNTKIDNEIARASSAETELQSAIEDEGRRASGAESTLNLKIEAESERAIAKELELDERIDEIISGTPIEQLDELIEKLGYKDNDTLQTTNEHEVAFGEWNTSSTDIEASGQTIFSIGIGTSAHDRKNAFEVRKDGTMYAWVEGGYVELTKIFAQLTNEVYDSDSSNNG